MFKKFTLFKELSRLELYQKAKSIGVVVPYNNSKKINTFYKAMIDDGKKLVFLNREDENRIGFKKPIEDNMALITGVDDILYVDQKYPDAQTPDFLLIEFNTRHTTLHSYVGDKINIPIIGFLNKYKHKASSEFSAEFILCSRKK